MSLTQSITYRNPARVRGFDLSTIDDPQWHLNTFLQMAQELHRNGRYHYFWTPNGGRNKDRDVTDWRPVDGTFQPNANWLCGRNLYFGVHPTTEVPSTFAGNSQPARPDQVRARNGIIAAVNCFYADLDGKDYVAEDEMLPFYIAPELAGLTRGQQRGALQRAHTLAVEAAYAARPDEYKARALAQLQAAPLSASYAWDSGGGYQAVWLLDKGMPVTEDNRDALRHFQREWVHRLGGDGGASDLARVLRVPGSTNFKSRYAPYYPVVHFIVAQPEQRYSLDEFTDLLPPVEQRTRAPRRQVHVPIGVPTELGDFFEVPKLPRNPLIDDFNRETDLRALLLHCGYTDAGPSRMNRPGGSTAGVLLYPNLAEPERYVSIAMRQKSAEY